MIFYWCSRNVITYIIQKFLSHKHDGKNNNFVNGTNCCSNIPLLCAWCSTHPKKRCTHCCKIVGESWWRRDMFKRKHLKIVIKFDNNNTYVLIVMFWNYILCERRISKHPHISILIYYNSPIELHVNTRTFLLK